VDIGWATNRITIVEEGKRFLISLRTSRRKTYGCGTNSRLQEKCGEKVKTASRGWKSVGKNKEFPTPITEREKKKGKGTKEAGRRQKRRKDFNDPNVSGAGRQEKEG